MAHRYGAVILVQRAKVARGALAGAPSAFQWRGVWYQVDETLATWRLRDRWWAAPPADVAEVAGGPGALGAPLADVAHLPTERAYYRVLCRDPKGEQVFDLYFDTASGQWVLDRSHD